jgi:hypothetical protein
MGKGRSLVKGGEDRELGKELLEFQSAVQVEHTRVAPKLALEKCN